METTKKGETDLTGIMGMAASVAIGFIVMVVILTLGGSLLATMKANVGVNSTGDYAAMNGSAGLLQFASQSTNIGLVIGIVVILLILVGGLGFFIAHRQE